MNDFLNVIIILFVDKLNHLKALVVIIVVGNEFGCSVDWIFLSLFNGISTFVGYLIPKPPL